MTARERLAELAETSGLRLLDEADPVWEQCINAIGQAVHARVSAAMGYGDTITGPAQSAPESRRARKPERAGYAPQEGEVLGALTAEPQTIARIADRIGEAVRRPVDMRALRRRLDELIAEGDAVATGERRARRYARVVHGTVADEAC